MRKGFWLWSIALTMLFPLTAWAGPDDEPLGTEPMAQEKTFPEYWLGIQFRPVFPALLAQLHLPAHQGIVVEAVVPDSPAAKAGLAQYDVILKADDKQISDVSDLLQAVEAAKDKEMKLDIIHDGQAKSVKVTPVKRPDEARLPAPPAENDIDAFRKWIEQLPPGSGFGQPDPMQFRFFRPGVILPRRAPIHAPLPGNMSISISKTGDKPADIVVKMGDEHWEVSEKDLDKLPEKVRPYVERMLGLAASTGSGAVRWVPEVTPPSPPEAGIRLGNNIENRIEKRLDEMKKQIERLENELRMRRQDANKPEPGQTPEKNKEEPQGKTAF